MATKKNKKKKKYSKQEIKIALTVLLVIVVLLTAVTIAAYLAPSLRNIAVIDEWMTIFEEAFGITPPDNTPTVIPDGTVAIYYIDVGQGDSTLIIAPNGETFLIDAGEDEMAADYLEKNGIKKIDYFLLTHYDLDHIGGADEVLELCEVETVIKPNCTPHNKTGQNLLGDFEDEGSSVMHPEVGDKITMGDVTIEFLVSSSDLPDDSNEKSICIMLTFGQNKFLFTGDAEVEREAEMIENYGKKLDADVYKAGHHGANNASGAELMALVTPEYAIFSCGEGNKYGHPTAGAIDRIDDYTSNLYRTDTMGTVIFYSDGVNITCTVEKGEAPTAWVGIVFFPPRVRLY